MSDTARRPIAAIDVGTNSVHVVVARPVKGGTPEILAREKEPVRLGEGSQDTAGTGNGPAGSSDLKRLDPDAIERAISALDRFRRLAEAFDAEVVAVATSAVREADNRDEFLQRALQEAGVAVEVISGVEEARLIHLGAIGSVPAAGRRHLVIDIGGGSTEIAIGSGTTPLFMRSLKLGHIRLTDRFFPAGAVSSGRVKACRHWVKSLIAPVAHQVAALGDGEAPPFDLAIGCSGTIQNLALMSAARAGVTARTADNLTLARKDLDALADDLRARPKPADRADMEGLDPHRSDVIVAGAIILRQLFRALRIETMTVSSGALREGVVLDRVQRRAPNVDPLHHLSDLRRFSVISAARRFEEDLTHEQHTTDLALGLFDQTAGLHGAGEFERDILEAAGMLHNVGRFVSHAAHHKHSYYLIRNSEHLAGFTENEVELIAQVGRYHRRSEPSRDHPEFAALSAEDRSRVRLLGGILRVACALDCTYRQAVLRVDAGLGSPAEDPGPGEAADPGDAASEDAAGSELVITAVAEPDADTELELYTASQRAGLLARALGCELRFATAAPEPAETDAAAGPAAPEWFRKAVAHEPRVVELTCNGAAINCLHWGEVDRPGLVFVHGGAAHAHWWSHLAPMFTPDYQVAALDLSGHGDSDRRDVYSLQTWTDEVAAVIDALDLPSPPVLIGHSMGGFVTIATAALHPDLLGGAVIIDSPVIAEDPEVEHARRTDDFKTPKTYDDPAVPIAKFRTIPAQENYLPFVKEHVARHSLKELPGGGFTWKFDPSIFMPRRAHASHYLSQIRCRVALLRCENGLVTPDIGDYMYEQLGRVAPVVELPTAGHHPMLDVPLILMTALRSLFADWDHSHPLGRQAQAQSQAEPPGKGPQSES